MHAANACLFEELRRQVNAQFTITDGQSGSLCTVLTVLTSRGRG